MSTNSVLPSQSTTLVSSFASDTSGKQFPGITRSHMLTSPSVGKQIVNTPSFIVRLDSQKHIDFALTSPFGGGRAGRVKRKRVKAAEKKDEDGGEEEEE